MHTPFVGRHRFDALDRLSEDFREVAAGNGPRVTFLQAPLGWGKTRLVHEFYRRLSAAQHTPYWPAAISTGPLESSDDVSRERKRLVPPPFEVPDGASPEWIWLGIASDPSIFARPEESHQRLVAQLEPHLVPVLRRKRMTAASLRALASIVSTLLPIPTEIDVFLELWGGARSLSDAWRDGRGSRTVATDSIDYSAQLWKLLASVWGDDGAGGPPVVLVIEDAQFLSSTSVDLLRLVLASRLPFFVIATGWELDGSDRFAAFEALVDSRPAGLRVESLQALDREEARDILDVLHPGTPHQVVDVLAQRFSSNPYALQVFLLNRDAEPGSPWNWSDLDWLEVADSDLHTELRRLLEQSDRATRIAVCAAAVIGYRIPTSLGDEAVARLAPEVSLSSAFVGGWMRHDLLGVEFAIFTEPIRHEAARALALARTSPAQLEALYTTAMTTLAGMITDDVPDADSALLAALYLELSEARGQLRPPSTEQRDDELLAACVVLLLRSFWKQRAYRAGASLLRRIDDLVDVTRLRPVTRAELVVQRARSQGLLVSPSSAALYGLTRDALEQSKLVADERPDLYAWALLARSRVLSHHPVPAWFDLAGAYECFTEAWELAERMPEVPALLAHSLRTRRYTLESTSGRRLVAHDLAMDAARVARQVFGPDSDQEAGALSDAAYYLARVDPLGSIPATRSVIELQERRWATSRHPRVATVRKDLAVRMLNSFRDDMIEEALASVESAYIILVAAYGSRGRPAINALSARSYARQRAAYLAFRRGNADAADQFARLALADAIEVQTRRRDIQADEQDSPTTRLRLAGARLAGGEREALPQMLQAIEERLGTASGDESRAEILWATRDLHEAYLRAGMPAEAAGLVASRPRAFASPYPPPSPLPAR